MANRPPKKHWRKGNGTACGVKSLDAVLLATEKSDVECFRCQKFMDVRPTAGGYGAYLHYLHPDDFYSACGHSHEIIEGSKTDTENWEKVTCKACLHSVKCREWRAARNAKTKNTRRNAQRASPKMAGHI